MIRVGTITQTGAMDSARAESCRGGLTGREHEIPQDHELVIKDVEVAVA